MFIKNIQRNFPKSSTKKPCTIVKYKPEKNVTFIFFSVRRGTPRDPSEPIIAQLSHPSNVQTTWRPLLRAAARWPEKRKWIAFSHLESVKKKREIHPMIATRWIKVVNCSTSWRNLDGRSQEIAGDIGARGMLDGGMMEGNPFVMSLPNTPTSGFIRRVIVDLLT